jgi:AAA domain
MNLQDIARATGGVVSAGGVNAPGPGHKPSDRSLRIFLDTQKEDGIRVHSFAGDDPITCKDHVRQKLGFAPWQPSRPHVNGHTNGHAKINGAAVVEPVAIETPARVDAPGANLPTCTAPDEEGKPKFSPWGDDGPPRRSNEIRRHIYKRGGSPVRIKVKQAGGYVQWFRVRSDDVTGWQAKKPDGYASVPYFGAIDPFDAELAGDIVFWTEGEKDCDTLGKINLPSFTFGGAGDGLPENAATFLADHHIVILADNDEPGRKHAEAKAALATEAAAASVRVVHFPELQPGGDVSDFLAAGGTEAELMQRVEAAPMWQPAAVVEAPERARPSGSNWRKGALLASALQGMTFAPVRYVLPGYVPEGVTILAGKPKAGKSWLALDLCLATAAGRFTLGTLKPFPGDVLYLALEDNPRRLKRRLAKLMQGMESKWPDRLTLQTEWRRADAGGIDDIEEWCQSVPEPTLIVVDTLEKIRPLQNGKTQAYSADYQAITGLQRLAAERGLAILICHHVRKMEADDPFDTISGTLGLTGAADTILVLKRQSGGVTLHARGRDIEESETAVQFNRDTCRWSILGAAADVHRSNERAAILKALGEAGPDGLAVSEIMVATGSTNRNATDQLIFKMKEAGEVRRIKRGIYALGKDAGKIGQKERFEGQGPEPARES